MLLSGTDLALRGGEAGMVLSISLAVVSMFVPLGVLMTRTGSSAASRRQPGREGGADHLSRSCSGALERARRALVAGQDPRAVGDEPPLTQAS